MTTSTRIRRIVMTLALLSLVPAAFAQTVGGSVRAESGKGVRTIEFNAKGLSDGRASGDLALTETIALPDQDVDGARSRRRFFSGGWSYFTLNNPVYADGSRAVHGEAEDAGCSSPPSPPLRVPPVNRPLCTVTSR
jgi:hypothetical protein